MTLLLLYIGAVELCVRRQRDWKIVLRRGWGKSMHHCVVRAWQADHANQPKTHKLPAQRDTHRSRRYLPLAHRSAVPRQGLPLPSIRPDPHSPVRHPVADSSVLCKKRGGLHSLALLLLYGTSYTHPPAPYPPNPRLGNLERATATAKKPCVLDHPTNQVPGAVP
jgi:hypothetical protein